MSAALFDIQIIGIKEETPECKTFYLESAPQLQYKPGQFLTFLFEANGKEVRRSYSFSSSPIVDQIPSITVKRNVNGDFSRWWIQHAKKGQRLQAIQPAGRFTLKQNETKNDFLMLAAGSGITPIYSLLKTLLASVPTTKIVLIYSNTSKANTIFYNELLDFEQAFPERFRVVWFFSDSGEILNARLGSFRLQSLVKEYFGTGLQSLQVFTCGPFDYMKMAEITLLTIGVAKTNIHRELFDINAIPESTKRYFDKKDRNIQLIVNGEARQVFVPYKKSILDAAGDAGIELPYSCKAGKCSTCTCHVVSGKIWMHYNEVLTDEDEAAGLALTCTGHPITEDVIIKI